MKLVLAILWFVALAAAQSGGGWGSRKPGDTLFLNVHVSKEPVPDGIRSERVRFAVTGVISSIHVRDDSVDGAGGHVSLLGGGVGFKTAILRIDSYLNKGFTFAIRVYGKLE